MLDKKWEGLDARIIHLVHDDIVEAEDDITETVADLVRENMAAGMNEILPNVPFLVEPEIRGTWGWLMIVDLHSTFPKGACGYTFHVSFGM
jgi:DNA polymerase I-like protein with 3'-5' exonuclease and polymerase domains